VSLDIYLRLRAAERRRAQPRAARRHAHLSRRPLVVVGYHLSGEPGAPVALRYGIAPDAARTIVVGEPRDRTLRYGRLARFATDLLRYLGPFTARSGDERGPDELAAGAPASGEPASAGPGPAGRASGAPGPGGSASGGPASGESSPGGGEAVEALCPDAPQLVCPNPTTAEWLTDSLGRQLRFLRPDGPHPVHPDLPVAGAHLTFLAGRRMLPGSSVVLAATDLLTTHWSTGQLPVEDAHLGAVLGWVDPPEGTDGPTAALAAEARPPAGPVSDPTWDREVLQPLIGEYGRARDGKLPETAVVAELTAACNRVLAPAWRDTWAALALVARLPEAGHVPDRWRDDRVAWTRHVERVEAGTAHFRRRLDQLQSFRFLHELERRTTALARQMALDDPLLLAAHVVDGDALAGELLARDCAHRITLPSGRLAWRPTLRLRPAVRFDRPPGTELWWVANPGVRLEVVGVEPDGVDLMVVAGACRSPARAAEILPEPGERMMFVGSGDDRFPDRLPDRLPWTHAPADEVEGSW
jgi:hypothetical protein